LASIELNLSLRPRGEWQDESQRQDEGREIGHGRLCREIKQYLPC